MFFTIAYTEWPGQSISVLLPTGIGGSVIVARTDNQLHASPHQSTDIDSTNTLYPERRCAIHFDLSRCITYDEAIILRSP